MMKVRIGLRAVLATALGLALWGVSADAAVAQQTGTIQGTVVDAGSLRPLGGAQVTVVGTGRGTIADGQGRFQIVNVPAGPQAVRAQLIGHQATEQQVVVQAGAAVQVQLQLVQTAVTLDDVIVTALGIERQERAIGVAATSVSGEELTRVEPNIVNALSGKVSGVHITSSGNPGGSSRVVIRGESSITGANQPLFVVDGVPISDFGGNRAAEAAQATYDFGGTVQDINPDDIESITVLKGPNAAALYGSRASNGAIVITTKKGGEARGVGARIVATQTTSWETPLRLPAYQNAYGQGQNGRFAYFDGDGNGVFDEYDESWGPPLDVGLMVPQFDSPLNPDGTRQPTAWVSAPNNVRDFFDLGRSANTSVSVAAATDRINGRFGVSHYDQSGMVPGFQLRRTALSFGGGMEATDRLNIGTSVQYVSSQGVNRPGIAYSGENPMSQFIWFGRQVDTNVLRQRWHEVRPPGDPQEGLPFNWNYRYFVNPYFLSYANRNEDDRNRLIGQASASYRLTDWLSASVRSGTDWFQENRLKGYAPLNFGGQYTTNPLTVAREYVDFQSGAFGSQAIGFQESNHDFILTATPELNLPFSVNATVGGNRRDSRSDQDYIWVSELVAPGIYNANNAAVDPSLVDFDNRKRVNSLYGQAEFGYNDFLYFTLTGRNDWSSTLPEGIRSYFYPSIATSFVFSDAVPALQDAPWLSYGKVRGSFARVGSDTDPYRLRTTYAPATRFGSLQPFTVPRGRLNPELRPEITDSWEFGTEMAFANNRLGLDLTWYNARTSDQIMPVDISGTTGFTSQWLNAGTVQNRGWEVAVRATPVLTRDFRWNTGVNWTRNENLVVSLAEGVTGLERSLQGFWGVSIYAREGEPLGQLVGSQAMRVENPNSEYYGQMVIHPIGIPRWTDSDRVLGNANPDWRAGITNDFSYRGANLNFLFDVRQGGHIFSVTQAFGRYAGVLEETTRGRCINAAEPLPGYPICTPETGILLPGVQRTITAAGDTVYTENTVVADGQTYWKFASFLVNEENILDASYVKLREATLSYDVPLRYTTRLGIGGGMRVGLTGRNLFLWTENPHIDPETAFYGGNVQGWEYGQMPTMRSFGFTVSVRP
jgi:TonB-linked SusC/RagA family outer membrane protein